MTENSSAHDANLMADYAVKDWVARGLPLDDLRVAVDKRLSEGDPSAAGLAKAIRSMEVSRGR